MIQLSGLRLFRVKTIGEGQERHIPILRTTLNLTVGQIHVLGVSSMQGGAKALVMVFQRRSNDRFPLPGRRARWERPDGDLRCRGWGGLKRILQDRGYHVLSIKAKSWLSFDVLARKEKLPTEAFLIFNQELAALLKAGLPLLNCLEVLAERRQDKLLRRILAEVIAKIRSGESLSDAFASYGDLFPKLYATTLRSGNGAASWKRSSAGSSSTRRSS